MTPPSFLDRAPDRRLLIFAVLLLVVCVDVFFLAGSEPFYNGDETRHVMTGVFFRDLYLDHPFHNLRQYTIDYYLQYPALGIGVWPPLFHAIEGMVMLVLGPSIVVAKFAVMVFSCLAAFYLFCLVEHTHDRLRATAAAVFFVAAPMTVIFSRQVMLEMPALAFVLMALFYWIRYLDGGKSRHIWLAAIGATAAALTRFDTAFFLVVATLLINSRKRWSRVLRPPVAAACACALAVCIPIYLIVSRELGSVHLRSLIGDRPGSAFLHALGYYPSVLPGQIGWIALLLAICGLVGCLQKPRTAWPYLALILAVYVVFTPLSEREPRHAIFWIPAWSVLAVEGIDLLSRQSRRAWLGLAAVAGVGTLIVGLSQARSYVQGYADAARYVVNNLGNAEMCFFDGKLDGNFIYQLRLEDSRRRIWVLRGDKVLYSVLSGDPSAGYAEYAHSDADILAELYKYGPGLIIVESISAAPNYTIANRLRAVLDEHPERFTLAAEFPVKTNLADLLDTRIRIFRNLARDPDAPKRIEMQMLMLGHPVSTGLP